jgi:hypothetical protein
MTEEQWLAWSQWRACMVMLLIASAVPRIAAQSGAHPVIVGALIASHMRQNIIALGEALS